MARATRIVVLRVIALTAVAWVTPVVANSPATIDQIVCSADVVVEATVLAARGTCVKAESSIRCAGSANALLLDLQIDRVLARKASTTGRSGPVAIQGASLTDVYVSGVEQFDGSMSAARTSPFTVATRYSGVPERRWLDIAATSDEAARFGNIALKGRTFVFAFPPRVRSSDGWFADMWDLDREGALLDLLKQTSWPGCPAIAGG